MRNYYKMMLGPKSRFAEDCYSAGYIGTDYNLNIDLSYAPADRKDFMKKYNPIYLEHNPENSKLYAPIVCNSLWVFSKGIQVGDIVFCPNGKRVFYFGEVIGEYTYHPNSPLPHQRAIKWFTATRNRSEVSIEMNSATKTLGTSVLITEFAPEIDAIIAGDVSTTLISTDKTVEDPTEFALEKHLEEFLVQNWKQMELGMKYDIYEEDGEVMGQQYRTDTGPIDILAISKDKKELLVVELKRGRASDNVVGQIQRYMGFVREVVAEKDQVVKGVIIAFEDDLKIKRALSVTNNIEFYRYEVKFKLFKG